METNAVTWLEKSYTYTTRCQGAIIENTLKKHQHTMAAEPLQPYINEIELEIVSKVFYIGQYSMTN